MNKRDARFDSKCKMKTSSHLGSIKNRTRIKGSEKAGNISEQLPVTPSVISAEMARVQANFEFDLVLQEIKHYTIFLYGYSMDRISWIQAESQKYDSIGSTGGWNSP